MKLINTFFIVFLLLLTNLNAQMKQPQGWNFSYGVGTITSPQFEGDDEYQLSIVPNIRAAYSDKFVASVGEGIQYRFDINSNIRLGAVLKFRFPRNAEDGASPFQVSGGEVTDLAGMGDIGFAYETGGFFEYKINNYAFNAEFLQGSGGHNGQVLNLGIRRSKVYFPFGPPIITSIGPSMTFATSDYTNTYFGISEIQSQDTGLAEYSASSGLVSMGISSFVMMPITRKLSVSMFFNLTQLSSVASRSPLVEDRGSHNQVSLGFFLSRSFK